MNIILTSGALFGLFSVAFGAYAEHGLKSKVEPAAFESLSIALRYNQIHAVALIAIGLVLLNPDLAEKFPLLSWSGAAFTVGILCFCFSIYGATLFNLHALTKLAPMGGITLMLGWLLLAIVGLKN